MKKLILSCSLMALTLPAYAADTINCATLPTCSELGYTEKASNCVGKKTLCPFDKTKATCIDSPQVGDLKYSLYSKNHDGWLRCDGKQYNIDDYQKLYDVIGTNFCRTFSSRTDTGTTGKCDSGYFAVPDYRGFFLRGFVSYSYTAVDAPVDKYGSSGYYSNALYYKGNYTNYNGKKYEPLYSDSLYIPQYERLPKITGKAPYAAPSNYQDHVGGALYDSTVAGSGQVDQKNSYGISFDASRSNVIYDGSHVVPANYAAYIFIYAGE